MPFGLRAGAGVAEVEQDLQLVDLDDQFAPERAQPAVRGFEAAVAHQIATVVDGLDDAHAESVEQLETIQLPFERTRVLETVDQTHAAAGLGSSEVARREDFHEVVGVIRDHLLRERDTADRFLELARAVADAVHGQVHRGDARRFHVRQHGGRQSGILRQIGVVATRPAEGVDHDRLGVRLFREATLRCCSPGDRGRGECRRHCRRQKFASIEHVRFSFEGPGRRPFLQKRGAHCSAGGATIMPTTSGGGEPCLRDSLEAGS